MIYRNFTKDIWIIGFTNVLVALSGLLLLPIVTKNLGIQDYGIWAQISVTIGLITPLILMGLPGAIVRFLAAEKEKGKFQEGFYSVLILTFAISCTIGILIIIFSGTIGKLLHIPSLFVNFLSLIIIFECTNSVLMSFFQAVRETKKYAFFTLLGTFGEIGLVFAAITLGYGLWGAVPSLIIVRVVLFLILFIVIFRKMGIKLPNFSKIKEYLSFGLPKQLSSVSYSIVTSSDRYLVASFLGITAVGYYSPAYTLGNTLNFLLYPLFFALPAVLSKSFDELKIDEVKNYLKYSLKYFLMLGIPAVFGLSILAKQMLTVLTTSDIASTSYTIVPFVALSILLYGITSIIGQILAMVKKTKISGVIWLIAALTNIALNFIFIPKLGIIGAAITTLIAYALACILITYYSFKELRFDIDWKFIQKSLLASILMAFLVLSLNPDGLLKMIATIILGAALYFILILAFRGFEKKEIIFFKNILSQSFK